MVKSWSEIFGEMADEVFQCYYTARFVEAVAKAGKKEYDLPMTVNCWLDKGQKPGKYPTGGPVAKLMLYGNMQRLLLIFTDRIFISQYS